MDIIVRKVLPEEAYEFSECKNKAWQSAYKGIVPDEFLANISRERPPERIKKLIDSSKDFECYCVIYDGKMIGVLIINKSRDEDKPDSGEITSLYLLEEYRGLGYGAKMIAFAIDRLKKMGYNEIILWAFEENYRARSFYKKSNFVFEGTKKEIIVGKPLTEVRYVLRNAL